MKKRITLVLVLVMVLTLTACRGNDDSVVTENTCTTSDTTVWSNYRIKLNSLLCS